jgi:ribosomal protein S8E
VRHLASFTQAFASQLRKKQGKNDKQERKKRKVKVL